MRTVPSTQMRSAFIPSSWFSRLPEEIRVSIRAGMSDIVLPVTRQRLLERAASLVGSSDPSAAYLPDGLDPDDAYSISRYLNDVRELSRNIERYNALADSMAGSFGDLSAMLEYLFSERIVKDTTLATPEFEEAVRHAERIRRRGPRARRFTVQFRGSGQEHAAADAERRQHELREAIGVLLGEPGERLGRIRPACCR